MAKKVIICSTGRSGTQSLCSLLNSNLNISIDHEGFQASKNVSFKYSEKFYSDLFDMYQTNQDRQFLNILSMDKNEFIYGDCGMYYLNYLEKLYHNVDNLKIIYLYREDEEALVRSFRTMIGYHEYNVFTKEQVLFEQNYEVPTVASGMFPVMKDSINSFDDLDKLIIIYNNLFKNKFKYLEDNGIEFFKIRTEDLSNESKIKELYNYIEYETNGLFLSCEKLNTSQGFLSEDKELIEARRRVRNHSDKNGNIIMKTDYKNKKVKRVNLNMTIK